MPRKPRKNIIGPNSLYHIVDRGNNERRIFRAPRDYRKFLRIIEEVKKKFPFYLYTFNLIPNHYHFEIETQAVHISQIMHRINFLYANYFHHRYKTSGHLFQDRFYSSLISKESYFWEVACYIDLNAVRSGLVKKPEDYKWSSYSIYCQKEYNGKLIDRSRFLEYFSNDLEKARLTYLKFVKDGLELKKKPKFTLNKKMV
jgi:REP element-mobilizing transposase RayT